MVDDRNYDFPASGVGTSLPNQVQGTYNEGSLIDFEVVVSAHHKGHFMYKVSTSIIMTVWILQVPLNICSNLDRHVLSSLVKLQPKLASTNIL
jgi:hypothetical protein